MSIIPTLIDFFKAVLSAPLPNAQSEDERTAAEIATAPPVPGLPAEKPVIINPHWMLPANMTISDNGVKLIMKFEGWSAKAFWDYKQWSIGYGTKAKSKDEIISKAEGFKRLKQEAEVKERAIQQHIPELLTQNMFDALVSFTYNVGEAWLTNGSSVMKSIRARNWEGVRKALNMYNRAGGQINQGLVERRRDEGNLFVKDI